ncbi:hypothetical protein Csa_011495 [Cucumis sativus]|uniref:Uncharacterized protein n=1 Tax=Cucumis sativus TaxID=3659 RepID=A0A0A0L4E5_CUCSA|nr:hypothetical protein Csa_011495 [Cucumis sativus]
MTVLLLNSCTRASSPYLLPSPSTISKCQSFHFFPSLFLTFFKLAKSKMEDRVNQIVNWSEIKEKVRIAKHRENKLRRKESNMKWEVIYRIKIEN